MVLLGRTEPLGTAFRLSVNDQARGQALGEELKMTHAAVYLAELGWQRSNGEGLKITEQADDSIEYDLQATPAELGWRRGSHRFIMIHFGLQLEHWSHSRSDCA